MSGWIRLHRGWRESDFFAAYRDSPLSEREAWLWIIENCAWKDMERRNHKGEIVLVKRGQMLTSLRSLQTAWLWNKNSIDRFLKRLEKHEMVELKAGQSGCLISIVNYGTYQSDGEQGGTASGQPRDSLGTASGQPRDTQEEGIRKDKKGEEENTTQRASRLSPDWELPDDWREFAKTEKGWSDGDALAEAEEFRDYWVARSGKDATKMDWLRTWRNWVRRSYRKPNSAPVNREAMKAHPTPPGFKSRKHYLEHELFMLGAMDNLTEEMMEKGRVLSAELRGTN
jgi:hypothetical protein